MRIKVEYFGTMFLYKDYLIGLVQQPSIKILD